MPGALFRSVARPLKFDTSDRFACMIHHWNAKNLLFLTVCCNINLVKAFGNYALLNTGSTAKNLRSRRDHNLSAWNQYYLVCPSYSIESQSYVNACAWIYDCHRTNVSGSELTVSWLLNIVKI